MMTYLLLANVYLGIFYTLYHYLLRKQTFFHWNRGYLSISLLLAYMLPLVTHGGNRVTDIAFGTVLPEALIINPMAFAAEQELSFLGGEELLNSSLWLLSLYIMGCCVTAGYVVWRFVQTFRHLRNKTGGEAYSFFGFIHIGRGVVEDERIVMHEQVHVRQWHSLDVMLIQVAKIFNWFNPAIYLYERSIKLQHEYIADMETAQGERIEYAELLISRALHTNGLVLAHEFANKSTLQQRVKMLLNDASSRWSLLRLVWVVPVLVGMVFFSMACNQASKDDQSTIEETQTEEMQTASSGDKGDADDSAMKEPEINAEPPGGMKAFMDYIAKHYEYSEEALEAGVNGMIKVSFIISERGELSDINVIEDLGHGTGDAAVQVLQNGPKWSPAIQDGKPVRSSYTLPIRLNLLSD